MRKKLNDVDECFIKHNRQLDVKELSKKLDVSVKAVQNYLDSIKEVVVVLADPTVDKKSFKIEPHFIKNSNGGRDGITIMTEQVSDLGDLHTASNTKYNKNITTIKK